MSHITVNSIWRNTACVDCAKVFGYRIENRLGRLPMCRCAPCAARIHMRKTARKQFNLKYRGF